MLSGPEGSGKSAILAAVVATLAYGGMRVIRVSNPDETTMGQRELAARILGRPTMGSPAQLVAEAITNLLATTDDGRVLLVVDDAHTLSDQAMELLLVITSPGRRGIRSPQLLLAGRGAFWERPGRDELREITDLAEKIILEPLTADDARDFVLDEAKASAGTIADVTPDALVALVRCSSGLNAQMDRIVTAAVALGNTRRATVLTEEIVDAVVTPDTLLEPPCNGPGPLSDSDARVAAAAIEVPAVEVRAVEVPATADAKRIRVGWVGIAGVVLVAMAAAAVGLVLTPRTEVTSPADRGVAVTSPASTQQAATAPEPPNVAHGVQLQQDHASESGAATTPSDTTSADVAASSSTVSPPVARSVDEPPAAVKEMGNPQATVTVSGDAPVASAPPPGHAGDASSAADASHGGDQQAAADPALSAPTDDTRTAPQAASPETARPEPPAVAPAPPPALATEPGPTQPIAPAVVAPTPIAPLPAAPPPTAVLPAVPPVAAAPPVAQPQSAPPPAPTPPGTASLSPSAIASLLKRGNDMLASGDILSARLYFERAGAAGSEEGAMAAGRTYDPEYLATIDAPGLQANLKRAIDWYRVAADHGNPEAQKRVDALSTASTR